MLRNPPKIRRISFARLALFVVIAMVGLAVILVGEVFLSHYQTLSKIRAFNAEGAPLKRHLYLVGMSVLDSALKTRNEFRRWMDIQKTTSETSVPKIEIKINNEHLSILRSNLPDSAKAQYFKGKIKYSDNSWVKMKFRLRGKSWFHWDKKKPSFRVRLAKGKKIYGQREIHLINPEDRAMVSEPYGEMLGKKFGLLTPRTKFVRLFANEKYLGLYHFATHETKKLFRLWGRPKGIIYTAYSLDINRWMAKDFETKSFIDTVPQNSPMERMLSSIYNENTAERYEQLWGILSFDKYAAWHALTALVGSTHCDVTHNHTFYYDPKLRQLEPVTNDLMGFGQQLIKSKVYQFWKKIEPDHRLSLNEKLQPLLDVALRDPFFYQCRNRHLYQALTGFGSTNQQHKDLRQLYKKIDSAVLSDPGKGAAMQVHVGWSRVPFSNEDYRDYKEVLLDWIERRNNFLRKKLEHTDVNIGIFSEKNKVYLQVGVEGHSAVHWNLGKYHRFFRTLGLSANRTLLEKEQLVPGLREAEAPEFSMPDGFRSPVFFLVPATQSYYVETDLPRDELEKVLVGSFSNAITSTQLIPKLHTLSKLPSIEYSKLSLHPWYSDTSAGHSFRNCLYGNG